MRTRRDCLQWVSDSWGKENIFGDPLMVKGVLMDSGMDRTDGTIIIDMLSNFHEDLEESLKSDDDRRMEIFRTMFISNTQWRESTITEILCDLFFFYNGRECSIAPAPQPTSQPPVKKQQLKDSNGLLPGRYCSICGVKTECYKANGGFVCDSCLPFAYRGNPSSFPVRDYREL